MTPRVFIAGATGVVGRRVVPELTRRPFAVTAIGRTHAKRQLLETMGASAVPSPSDECGRLSRELARKILAGHDVAINLATHMPSSATRMLLPWEWRENDRIRRDDSSTLVDASIDVGGKRFIQESFALEPAPTCETVLDAENSTARFTAAGGVGIVLRFAALYGPDAVFAEMIRAVRQGWSPLPGTANAYWSSLAQDDAASATVAAIHGAFQRGLTTSLMPSRSGARSG